MVILFYSAALLQREAKELFFMTLSPTTKQSPVFQNFIGGRWLTAKSGETFTRANPARSSDITGVYQKSSLADLEDAVAAATQTQPAWAATPAPERGEILLRTATL